MFLFLVLRVKFRLLLVFFFEVKLNLMNDNEDNENKVFIWNTTFPHHSLTAQKKQAWAYFKRVIVITEQRFLVRRLL